MKTRISFSKVMRRDDPSAPPPDRRSLLLAGCGSDDDSGGVVATTTQVADLARNVAGDRIAVAGILTPNADPHGYEPRARDVKRLAGAQARRALGRRARRVARGGAGRRGLERDASSRWARARREEPHWWQDPRRGDRAPWQKLGDGLIEGRPGRPRDVRGQRARATRERLRALDRDTARCIADDPAPRSASSSPPTTRSAPTRSATGCEVIAHRDPVALDARAGLGGRDARELVRTIERERVPAIFAESSVRSDVEQAIAREAGARVAPALYADSLGPEGLAGRDLRGVDRVQHAHDRRGAGRALPVSLAPYMQRALVEIALLARARGRARRLDRAAAARVLHPLGRHRGVPGPRRRRPVGDRAAARRAGLGARLRGRARAARARRWTRTPRRASCSSARSRSARCWPRTSTSPARASTGCCSAR